MKNKGNLWIGFIILLGAVVLTTIIGLFALRKPALILQGEAEATEVRVSGKVPGRILALYAREGERVEKGDTLVYIDSPEVVAKLTQARAAQQAAQAQSIKANKGARVEQISGAYQQWQRALAAADLAGKSYTRVQNLYDKGVMPAQKRDEAEANLIASQAAARAAESQYDMAVNGADREDKEAAQAMVERAKGAVAEVESYLAEIKLVAPISGEISDIFPKQGELVGTGAPIMNIIDLDDTWITFNVKEEYLSRLTMGKQLKASVPALGGSTVLLEIYYIKAMASYADWKATKVASRHDSKTFEVRMRPVEPIVNLRPGMTVLVEWKEIKE